jgi:hypothetical protein
MGCGCLNKKKVEIISNISENKNINEGINHNNNINHRHSISLNENNNVNNDNNQNNNQNNNNNNNQNNNSNQNNNNNQNNNLISNSNDNNENIQNNINNINQELNNLSESNSSGLAPSYEPYLQSKHDENFNYKELDKYVGTGIKRMKGYISPVPFEELEKIRNDFWSSRIEGNPQIWEILHMICNDNSLSVDDIDAYMKASNIVTYKGCINVTYDNKGFLYEIPNYCINDPLEYEKFEEKKPLIKEDIEVKIRCFNLEEKIKINNFDNITEIKENIKKCEKFNKKYELNNIRLFFGGKELNDKKEVWYYNIQNNSIIQMLANPLENKIKLDENKNTQKKLLSSITLDNDEEMDKKERENEEENLQETFTEQNKLLIKVNK